MNMTKDSSSEGDSPRRHRTLAELEAGLNEIRSAPAKVGTLAKIVRRPAVDEREVLERGKLDLADGLVGDGWKNRRRSPHPDTQLTLMGARAIAVIAGDEERWELAGDQLFVDLDLSTSNAPPGTRLAIGDDAVIEVTDVPHNGCRKFSKRFGLDAARFINSPEGRRLKLRGVYARVVRPGTVRASDAVRKL